MKLRRDEWVRLVDRERSLESANQSLRHQVEDLKARLCALQGDEGHFRHTVQQLECQINRLATDNAALRRSLDSATTQLSESYKTVDKLEGKLEKVEKDNHALKLENSDLKSRIRELSRQVGCSCGRRVDELRKDIEHWKERMLHWKELHDDLLKRFNETCRILECRTDKMRAYEDILKRRGIIC